MPTRCLVICFELRHTGGAWEYRPAGKSWGYSVPFAFDFSSSLGINRRSGLAQCKGAIRGLTVVAAAMNKRKL